MSSDRFRYAAACWRVTSRGPGGAQDGESCGRAVGRAGGTRTCVRAGSWLSPGLSPRGFVRRRPGRPRRRWLAMARGSVVADLTGSHGASFAEATARGWGPCAVVARGRGAADLAGSCAADIAPSRLATINHLLIRGRVFLLSGPPENWVNLGAQSFRV